VIDYKNLNLLIDCIIKYKELFKPLNADINFNANEKTFTVRITYKFQKIEKSCSYDSITSLLLFFNETLLTLQKGEL
jgi:hypothetical protein